MSKMIDTSNTGFEANNDVAFQSKKDGGVTVSRVSGGVKKDKQTAYRNDLRRIWRDKNIEDLQTTVDALEQVKIEDDAIWRDIVDYLAKVGDNGFKKGLLNFVATRLGLIDENDGDKWWDGLSDNAAHLLAYLRENGGRASYRDGINGLSYDDAKDAVWHLMAHGFVEDFRYQFEVELSVN